MNKKFALKLVNEIILYTEDITERGAEEGNWAKKDDVTREWGKLLMRSFMILTP